ncbi:MAG: hypothetical protein AB7O04_03480 [Hyphomonadaceae bacterium]
MSKSSPDARNEAAPAPGAKSQWPVIVGSFVTGVAAMTLVGVLAPAIATAANPAQIEAPRSDSAFESAPMALTEITEAQRQEIEARIAEAERMLAEADAFTDEAASRLDRLTPRS